MKTSIVALKRVFMLIGAYSLFLNLLVLAVPLYMLQIYDRVLASRSTDTLVMISILAVLALAVYSLLEGVRGIMANRAAARFGLVTSKQVFERLMQNEQYEQAGSEFLRDVSTVRSFIGGRIALSLLDLPFTPIFIALVFFVHPMLGYLTLSGSLLLLVLATANDRFTILPEKTASIDSAISMNIAQSILRNSDSVKAMGILPAGLAKWGVGMTSSLRGQDQVSVRNSAFSSTIRFFRLLLQIAILGLGAYFVLIEEMTAGMIFASSIIASRALAPIDQAVGGWKSMLQARVAYQRLEHLFNATEDNEVYTELPEPKGQIDVEKLVYSVRGTANNEPILKNISFSLEPGEILAVVGPSGAGKSTLARLLVGAIKPTSGSVRLDGADINLWPDRARFRHVGYLPQSIELMPGTIAENIARYDIDRSDEQVIKAAERANVHGLITLLSKAYETPVGPGSRSLSGGQVQRVAIARAFYGSPRFVVLDEPNAYLDNDGEKKLSQTILAAKKEGITTIIVTQRMPILKVVDQILFLRDGSADALGPRDEILARLMGGASEQLRDRQRAGIRKKDLSKAIEEVVV